MEDLWPFAKVRANDAVVHRTAHLDRPREIGKLQLPEDAVKSLIFVGYCGRCLDPYFAQSHLNREVKWARMDAAEAALKAHEPFCRSTNSHHGITPVETPQIFPQPVGPVAA